MELKITITELKNSLKVLNKILNQVEESVNLKTGLSKLPRHWKKSEFK